MSAAKSDRSFGISIVPGGSMELEIALAETPLSDELKRLLLLELFDADLFQTGSDGVLCLGDMPARSASDTHGGRDFVCNLDLGTAGKSVVAALRALRSCAVSKIEAAAHGENRS